MQEKLYNLTNKQQEKDSEVYGAIMAGVKTRKKKLRRGVPAMENPRGICAVGAGNRGRKVTQPSDVVTKSFEKKWGKDESTAMQHQTIPLIRFATSNGVSENYACGVNDGFEGKPAVSKGFFYAVDTESLDYERGFHVGQAVAIESGF